MNCIDAIEGTAKTIILKLHEIFVEHNLDDSEYIRNVKAVLSGTNEFLAANKEIIIDPNVFQQVLYEFSKELWFSELGKRREPEPESNELTDECSEHKEYYQYYFDYLYANDTYPP